MDAERAIHHVEELLAALRTNRVAFSLKDEIYASNRQWRESQDQILSRQGVVVSIAQEIDAGLAQRIRDRSSLPWEWGNAEEACFELLGHLRYRDERLAKHETTTPPAAIELERVEMHLHPDLWRSAAGAWERGRYRDAVSTGMLFLLGTLLPAKLQVFDLPGFELMRQALSLDPPGPGRPRLRLPRIGPDTPAWVNAHEGVLHFGIGCMQASAEMATEPLAAAEALQFLLAFSMLAKWIDESEVIYWDAPRR